MWHNTKVILGLAFGSFLLMMAILGFGAFVLTDHTYRDVEASASTREHQLRILSEIRSDIYLSSILVRDFMLNPDSQTRQGYREQLFEIRKSTEENLDDLGQILTSQDDRDRFRKLSSEMENFWSTLNPISDSPEGKTEYSFEFLSKKVLPRRTAVIQMLQGIDQIVTSSLEQERERIAGSWRSSRAYLVVLFAFALALAVASTSAGIYRYSVLEKRANEDNRRLAAAEKRYRLLVHKLISVQEEDRKSLSRELHDEIGQYLTAIRMVFGNLNRLRTAPDGQYEQLLAEGKSTAERALKKIRNLALGLRPSMLDDLGLLPALEWQAREFSKHGGTQVLLKTEGSFEKIPEAIRTCIYRIVQESLTNCARHSQAKTIDVALYGNSSGLSLTIRDDGVGFKCDEVGRQGIGLIGIRERVHELGGIVRIDSQPGEGTILKVQIPLKSEVSA